MGNLPAQAAVLPALVKFSPALVGNLAVQAAVLPALMKFLAALVVFYTYTVKQNMGLLCNMVLLESDN